MTMQDSSTNENQDIFEEAEKESKQMFQKTVRYAAIAILLFASFYIYTNWTSLEGYITPAYGKAKEYVDQYFPSSESIGFPIDNRTIKPSFFEIDLRSSSLEEPQFDVGSACDSNRNSHVRILFANQAHIDYLPAGMGDVEIRYYPDEGASYVSEVIGPGIVCTQ